MSIRDLDELDFNLAQKNCDKKSRDTVPLIKTYKTLFVLTIFILYLIIWEKKFNVIARIVRVQTSKYEFLKKDANYVQLYIQ